MHILILFIDIRTYSWIINSIARLIALIGYVPEYLHSQLAVYLAWEDTDVQQVHAYIYIIRILSFITLLFLSLIYYFCSVAVNYLSSQRS